MTNVRINIVTYNIWNTERWAQRENALRAFMQLFDPDLLCVQELRRKSRQFLDTVLTGHERVQDKFAGWMLESNIYWRKSMFSEVEHGAEDVQIREAGHRRLFWVRLQVKARDHSRHGVDLAAKLRHEEAVHHALGGQLEADRRADGDGQLIDGRDALVGVDEQPFPVERDDLNTDRFRGRGNQLTRIKVV